MEDWVKKFKEKLYFTNAYVCREGNKDRLFLPQVNIALGFSHEKKIPVFIKILPGFVRE